MKIEQGQWTEGGRWTGATREFAAADLVFILVHFESARVRGHRVRLAEAGDGFDAGRRLAAALAPGGRCEFHNQTMTVTTFTET